MPTLKIVSTNEKQTISLAKKLSKFLRAGDIICLNGELGSGKTTFVRGLAAGLGVDEADVHSPTFVLLNIYNGKKPLYHYDFYRLTQPELIAALGYEEFLYGQGISAIEWASRLKGLMPQEFLEIDLTHQKDKSRKLVFKSHGKHYQEVLKNFKESLS